MEVSLRKKLEGEKSQTYAAAMRRLSYSLFLKEKKYEEALQILLQVEPIFTDKNNYSYAQHLYRKG